MSRAVVLLWLGAVAGRGPHEPDLTAWAASRMVALEEPVGERSLASAEHDDQLSARIEGLLSEARTAGYGAEPGAAEAALDSAELLLRGNPSLPEAPWLMAETCRDHAALVKSHDPELAAILERRANVLEGARAQAFAEEERAPGSRSRKNAAAVPPSGTGSGPLPEERGGALLEGPLATDEVDVDGFPQPSPRLISGGEHHVRVIRRGQLAWAGWVTPEAESLRIPMPAVVPCSDTDFVRVHASGARVDTGGSVLCPHWAVARDVSTNRIEVSLCERNLCSTFLPWSREWGKDLEGPMHPPWPPRASHTWISVTAATVTVLAAGAILLRQEGAFDRQGPPRERTVWGGSQ
ncbi:MAG TPA: hypothetical protein VF395_20415 [Polyangiaceae bacterium]